MIRLFIKIFSGLVILIAISLVTFYAVPQLKENAIESLLNQNLNEYFKGSLRLKSVKINSKLQLEIDALTGDFQAESGVIPVEVRKIVSIEPITNVLLLKTTRFEFEDAKPSRSLYSGVDGVIDIRLGPDWSFKLEGDKGFLKALEDRLIRRGHAVILVSEGAAQDHMAKTGEKDASGNIRLPDIGLFMRDKINSHFKQKDIEVNLKYIDPSYVIRAVEAIPVDSYYCLRLGQHAVHAAMSGRTKMVVGLRHNQYVHFPMELIASGRRQVDPTSDLWLSVLEATGQPAEMVNQPQKVC